MIKRFNEYEKPKYKKGDRCVYVYPIGKHKFLSVLDDNMIIEDEAFWNEEKHEWYYPIVGKQNPTNENSLRLYNGQDVGDIVNK